MNPIIYKLYNKLPVPLQNFTISLYGVYWKRHRYGIYFHRALREFKEREQFNKEQWRDFQEKHLRKLLIHAYENVPFYHEKYSKHGLSYNDLKFLKLNEINKLPFLEKDELRKFGTNSLLSRKRDKGIFLSSSGSTGTPVKIYYSRKFHQTWNAAYEARVRNWAGVNMYMRRAMIGGRRILPEAEARPPFYRFNYVEKQLYLSAYHLSEKTAKNYVDGIRKHHIEYLVGYAMSIYFLAEFVNELQLKAPKLKAVLTSSEKLTDRMRNTISKAFQCPVFDAYSGVEACGLISENSAGKLLFSPDTGIMEVLDEYQMPSLEGEVVFTGLINYDQPLIRYRIGDRVRLSNEQRTEPMPVVEEIEGRIEDVIVGKDGRKMVRFHSLFYDLEGIVASQIVQYSPEEFEIRIIKDNLYKFENEKIISRRMFSQLGQVKIRYTYPGELEKTNSGKIKAVISKMS